MTGDTFRGQHARPQEIYYTVRLFVDEKVWKNSGKPLFSLEKANREHVFPLDSEGTPSPRNLPPPIDLLRGVLADKKTIVFNDECFKDDNLCLVIEDNTAEGRLYSITSKGTTQLQLRLSGQSRSDFYNSQIYRRARARALKNPMAIEIPLRVEVKKFVWPNKSVKVKNGEVYAMLEVDDPPEDTGIVQGPPHNKDSFPTPRTGKQFIEKFIKEIKNQQARDNADDNCANVFASEIDNQQQRCRTLGRHVDASKILYNFSTHAPLPAVLSGGKNKAKLEIKASRRKSKLEGTAILLFLPPLIFGDNYTLKVTLHDAKGKAKILRTIAPTPQKRQKVECFQTPKITLWKKVRLHMVVHQEGVKYDASMLKEIESAYHDAFIIIEKPIEQRIIKVKLTRAPSDPPGEKDWIEYLEDFVYKNSHLSTDWTNYRAALGSNRTDYQDYSFPQPHKSDTWKKLTPSMEPQANAPAHWESYTVIRGLAQGIIQDKLAKDTVSPVNWTDFGDPLTGARIGLCAFICKPPSSTERGFGEFAGGKVFYAVQGGDLPACFVHEMGHALFLNHGATRFQDVYNKSKGSYDHIIVKELRTGSSGPFFEEHDCEDMLSCVMSYYINYYDHQGKRELIILFTGIFAGYAYSV